MVLPTNAAYFSKDDQGQTWFMEKGTLWPGQAFCLKVKEVLYHRQSKYQDVLVFQSTDYGTVLVLDGVIQVTERDEFAYQEMISHLPLNAHPCPRKVLVIGGGDGGVLREVVKHKSVEEVTLVEIDGDVIEVSKRFLPTLAEGFAHEKVKVHVGDGFEFLKNNRGFDVIITDSSDPVGPAESLFQDSFFELLKNALKPNGIVCSQGECLWLHSSIISKVYNNASKLFPNVRYGYTSIPSYPSGQIGFMICSLDQSIDLTRVHPEKNTNKSGMSEDDVKLSKYYNNSVHSAAFCLPSFAQKVLKQQ